MTAKTTTLDLYLADGKNTIAETGPAYYVHPRHKSLPPSEQKRVLIEDAEEVLFESGVVLYVCTIDKIVFDSPDGLVMHKRRSHAEPKIKESPRSKSLARRKTQSNARPELDEPTYGQLKQKLDDALTRVGELDHSLQLRNKDYTELLAENAVLRVPSDDPVDHSQCFEYVGKGRGNEGKEVDIVRKDGYVYRAYPV